jgi:hypothetical protein
MNDINIEGHSQVSLDRLKEMRIEKYSKMSLEELLSDEYKKYASESYQDINNLNDLFKLKKYDLGAYFSHVKFKCKHGEFETIMKQEFPLFSSRTVRRYMQSFLNGDKVINKIANNKNTNKIRAKKERGETLTPAEERAYIIQNTAMYLKKVLKLMDIHGVNETLENYIPENKKDSVVTDIVFKSTKEVSTKEKKLHETIESKIKHKSLYEKAVKEEKKLRKEIQDKTQFLLELKSNEK